MLKTNRIVESWRNDELQKLDAGKVAYIKSISHDQVLEMFPNVTAEELPEDVQLYVAYAANGNQLPIIGTCEWMIGSLMREGLDVVNVN